MAGGGRGRGGQRGSSLGPGGRMYSVHYARSMHDRMRGRCIESCIESGALPVAGREKTRPAHGRAGSVDPGRCPG